MDKKTYVKIAAILTFGGVLFSGYLSATKLFTGTCAFNESCPYFLGYPACWYGFAMFLIMFVANVIALINIDRFSVAVRTNFLVSFIGMIFSGSFTVIEIFQWLKGTNYALVLPTCAYGFIFYLALYVLTIYAMRLKTDEPVLPWAQTTHPGGND